MDINKALADIYPLTITNNRYGGYIIILNTMPGHWLADELADGALYEYHSIDEIHNAFASERELFGVGDTLESALRDYCGQELYREIDKGF